MTAVRSAAAGVAALGFVLGLASCASNSQVHLQDLQTGQCVKEAGVSLEAEYEMEFEMVYEVVDCEKPHQSEVTAVLPLSFTEYDAGDIVKDLDTRCKDVFATYVGADVDESPYYSYAAFPTMAAWESGVRVGVCLVTELGTELTGSVAGVLD